MPDSLPGLAPEGPSRVQRILEQIPAEWCPVHPAHRGADVLTPDGDLLRVVQDDDEAIHLTAFRKRGENVRRGRRPAWGASFDAGTPELVILATIRTALLEPHG
jgi:hypothetical protein